MPLNRQKKITSPMSRDLPPLNALRAFEAAARLQSFSQAAEELSVTHGAVSRQIRALEAQLGVALFVKDGRGVKLTEAGMRLRDVAFDTFERLREVCQRYGIARLEVFGSAARGTAHSDVRVRGEVHPHRTRSGDR